MFITAISFLIILFQNLKEKHNRHRLHSLVLHNLFFSHKLVVSIPFTSKADQHHRRITKIMKGNTFRSISLKVAIVEMYSWCKGVNWMYNLVKEIEPWSVIIMFGLWFKYNGPRFSQRIILKEGNYASPFWFLTKQVESINYPQSQTSWSQRYESPTCSTLIRQSLLLRVLSFWVNISDSVIDHNSNSLGKIYLPLKLIDINIKNKLLINKKKGNFTLFANSNLLSS